MRAARSRTQTLRTTKTQRIVVSSRVRGLRTSVFGRRGPVPSGWRCSWPPHAVGVVGSGTGACTPHKQHINTTPSRQWQVLAAGGCVAYGAWSKRVGRRLDAPQYRSSVHRPEKTSCCDLLASLKHGQAKVHSWICRRPDRMWVERYNCIYDAVETSKTYT